MAKRNTFTKIGGGVFTCRICKGRTRHTGVQSIDAELCPDCYELAGYDNMCNDDGRKLTKSEASAVKAHINSIAGRANADVETAKTFFKFLWKKKVARGPLGGWVNDGWTLMVAAA